MPNNCWVPFCNSGTRSCTEKVRIFKVKAHYVNTWSKIIQRIDKPLSSNCYICEKHFEEHYILKDYVHNINSTEVRIPRDAWKLSDDAVPTKFVDLPSKSSLEDCKLRRTSNKIDQSSYYTEFLSRTRTSPEDRRRKSAEMEPSSESGSDNATPAGTSTRSETAVTGCSPIPTAPSEPIIPATDTTPLVTAVLEGPTRPHSSRYEPPTREQQLKDRRRLYKVQYQLHLRTKRMRALKQENKQLLKRVEELERTSVLQGLPERQQMIVDHMIRASCQEDMRGMRYSTKYMLDCIRLRLKSPSGYEFMRDNDYLPLPEASSLQKCVADLSADSASDPELFQQLQKKLSSIPRSKRGDENNLHQRIERALSDFLLTNRVRHKTLPPLNESEQSLQCS